MVGIEWKDICCIIPYKWHLCSQDAGWNVEKRDVYEKNAHKESLAVKNEDKGKLMYTEKNRCD